MVLLDGVLYSIQETARSYTAYSLRRLYTDYGWGVSETFRWLYVRDIRNGECEVTWVCPD